MLQPFLDAGEGLGQASRSIRDTCPPAKAHPKIPLPKRLEFWKGEQG